MRLTKQDLRDLRASSRAVKRHLNDEDTDPVLAEESLREVLRIVGKLLRRDPYSRRRPSEIFT